MKTISNSTTRAFAFFIAMLMLIGVCLSACTEGTPSETTASTESETQGTNPSETTKPQEDATTGGSTEPMMPYSVELVSAGGLKLSGATVLIYANEGLVPPIYGHGTTNEEGVVIFDLPTSITTYYAVIQDGIPEGYEIADSYPLTGSETKIVLESKLITDFGFSGTKLQLGDVMRDFTVTTTDGETFTLSEVLKTKKAVLINFWFSTCSPCISEFPHMNSAYEQYKDDIAVVALNHYYNDTEDTVKLFKSSNNLTMPMAKENTGMQQAFNIDAYPTSIIVDRYGVICVIAEGSVTSETPFLAAFEHFASDDYTQRLEQYIEAFAEIPTPDTDMPSSEEISAAINGSNINVTYRAESDEAYADTIWDFELAEKDGVKCLVNTNQGVHDRSSLIYLDVELKAGQALKFDYFASCEKGADMLNIIIDNVQIYQISGESTSWETCFPYVALKDGTYTVAIAYIKDSSDSVGEDSVYIKNVDVCDVKDINVATYIPRNCATELKANGFGYENYVDVVFNEKDGYYHVGTADGPLLLANLMGYRTPFAELSVFDLAYSGQVVVDGVNFYDEIVQFFNYASNASINGVCTVDKELAELLKTVAYACGLEVDNDKQWLQMCCYYDVYGGIEQLEDPIKGLCAQSAYVAEMGKDNVVTYDRIIMPRGLMYKFVPETSGAYRITSDSAYMVEAWIFNADRTLYYEYTGGERLYLDLNNCSMVVYFEAGRDYYIDIAFYDVYQFGSFTFKIEYIAPTYDHFTIASPGFFTFLESEDGVAMGETISGGIKIALGDDGYYHELRADGTLGSILYADFTNLTPIFSQTLIDMINMNGFNFSFTEQDLFILRYYILYDKEGMINKLKEEWGEFYEEYYEEYKVDEVLAGIYHGKGEDWTALAQSYADSVNKDPEHPELNGCVAVDEQLAVILQALMDKYTFADVDYSWAKVCYYYQYIGPSANN